MFTRGLAAVITRNNPLEDLAIHLPMVCDRYELRDDVMPGAGRFRGGIGVVKARPPSRIWWRGSTSGSAATGASTSSVATATAAASRFWPS